jgi:asparagine synthase (glutamine-hydrolysing)
MCGIWAFLFNTDSKRKILDNMSYNYFRKISNRGPDKSIFHDLINPYNIQLGFHRLAIMDTSPLGDQPFIETYINNSNKKRFVYLICNGEIYNYRELATKYNINLKTNSDCEIISKLYMKVGIHTLAKELIGEYAFIIVDAGETKNDDITVNVCSDTFGIRPLFYCIDDNGINFASEIKGLVNIFNNPVERFKPRNYMTIKKCDNKWSEPKYTEYYTCQIYPALPFNNLQQVKKNIHDIFYESVRCRLISDRPLGCLLSGGLDSSLVASIASNILRKEGKTLKTFSIGMPNSTDEKYARLVAKHIGSEHTHIDLEQSVWINNLNNVIKATETFDITTIRASTGQYLISKWISENTDIKVLLIGDGSDELCSGYIYFHNAPTPDDLHKENIRLVEDIHLYDVLRADRGISSNGLEARVPFLDKRFVNYYLSVEPLLRTAVNGMEKWLLRESFNHNNYLPDKVLFRRKEAFSDGV